MGLRYGPPPPPQMFARTDGHSNGSEGITNTPPLLVAGYNMGAILDLPCPSVILWLSFCDSVTLFGEFSSHFSQQPWSLQSWNLVYTWAMGGCIVRSRNRLLLLIRPFLSSCFFLSNFQPFKHFVALFSWPVSPTKLKLGTHVHSGWMYRVSRNQTAAAYSSLYSCFFLSNFQCHSVILSICNAFKWNLGHIFLSKREVYKVETWYTCGQWVDVTCILEIGCCWLFVPFVLHLSFYQIFKH